jgi:hypothetical protein
MTTCNIAKEEESVKVDYVYIIKNPTNLKASWDTDALDLNITTLLYSYLKN